MGGRLWHDISLGSAIKFIIFAEVFRTVADNVSWDDPIDDLVSICGSAFGDSLDWWNFLSCWKVFNFIGFFKIY